MIKIQKQQQNAPLTVIRAAAGNELTNYEKKKLSNIEENAQENRVEALRINGVRVPIDNDTKIADISLGSLSFKNTVSQDDLDPNEYFFIRCELGDPSM
jgi:hypothetical protein